MRQRAGAFRADFLQHAACAIAATSTAHPDAELESELVERRRPGARAFLELPFGYRVADADVQDALSLRTTRNKVLLWGVSALQ